ncbi:MAG: hypothetical protein L7F77_12190 [Candidatus Magnetominusculus sp. LBB02]|nr:hypothetical protein [Candidatus Magnetominusculus sp. LBB02]
MLDTELKYFKENLEEWLKYYEGQYALVKDDKLIKTFTTFEEAYDDGVKRFGRLSFLVKQIVKQEISYVLPALTLGLIRAHS